MLIIIWIDIKKTIIISIMVASPNFSWNFASTRLFTNMVAVHTLKDDDVIFIWHRSLRHLRWKFSDSYPTLTSFKMRQQSLRRNIQIISYSFSNYRLNCKLYKFSVKLFGLVTDSNLLYPNLSHSFGSLIQAHFFYSLFSYFSLNETTDRFFVNVVNKTL